LDLTPGADGAWRDGQKREMIGVSVGQYECQRLLGEGGTGMVYLAVHRVLNTPRAVKVLRAEWTRYPELVERFVNEARAAAAIRHRNIIGVHDCGQLESGERYILLDYLEGGTLARFLQSHGGPLAPHDAVHVLAEVANGLQAAHDHHIVHRDLKPDNIYLTSRDGDPRAATILDFGVAKLVERSGGTHSASGGLWGTPVYMAPEQLRGERVGPEADVFALGVIAYQMMSGGPLPYQRDEDRQEYLRLSPVELYERIKGGPVDLRRHNPQLAPAWIAAISAALEPDPTRRLQTPRQLALRLAEATPGDGFLPSGISMVQTYARELLEVGTSAATAACAIRRSARSALAAWGRCSKGCCSAPRASCGRSRSSGCTWRSTRSCTSTRCSSTRRGWPRS
jgi:eukaryotic-like serine/threonine-protein kinase